MPAVTLAVPARLESLEQLRGAVDSFCEASAISDATAGRLQLVVEELFVNIVSHSTAGEWDQRVESEIELTDAEILLTLRDHGPEFDATRGPVFHPDLPLAERRIGGIGLHLVRSLTTEFTYTRSDETNIVRLKLPVNS